MSKYLLSVVAIACLFFAGCADKGNGTAGNSDSIPVFSVAVSEYPSWSTFLVADLKGLIDKDKGKLGSVEKKWGVDIVVKECDYDTCLTLYGAGTVDASCQTNMDSLAPAISRPSVALGPTSTSVGADACITVGVDDIDSLKAISTYGLEKSVAQFAFERGLVKKGYDPKEFTFKNMDPAAAAQAMQQGQENINSIQVWNPFVLQTVRTRDGATVLFDSSIIPEEIIDMIVVGKDVLDKPGGENFACCLLDTFYQLSKQLGPSLGTDPLTASEATDLVATLDDDQKKTLVALGSKFSNLPAEDMAIVVRATRFYKTADEGLALYNSKSFQTGTTPTVTDFCVSHNIVDEKPSVGFDDDAAQLNYTTKFMERVKSGLAGFR